MRKAKVFAGLTAAAVFVSLALSQWLPPPAARFARYRFAVDQAKFDSEETAALEKRVQEMPGRGLDLADLALRYVNLAKVRADRSLYDRADALAKQSLALMPAGNATSHVALAKVAEANHRFETALDEAKAALRESPDSSGAWSVLVTANLARGQIGEASNAADTLVALNPSTAHRTLRALTLLAQNRDPEALAEFQAAFRAEEPGARADSAWTRALLGRYWLSRNRLREAEWTLNEAVRIAPESDLAHSLLAEVRLRRGDAEGGAREARRALELAPQARYLRQLALALAARGDKAGSEGYLREAEGLVRTALEREGTGHRLELVQILLERGGEDRAREAVALARAEVALRPSAETHFWLAKALLASGDAARAAAAAEESLRRGERTPERYRLAADVQRRLKHRETADLYERLAKG